MEMQFNIGDEIPVQDRLQRAVSLHAPGAPCFKTCRVLANSNRTRVVVRVGDDVVVKFGAGVYEAEARSMLFVASATNIAIPTLHGVLVERDSTYIVMSYVRGQPLDKVWDTLSAARKDQVSQQLDVCFSQLARLQGKYIGTVDGGPCIHPRLTNIPKEKRGPFQTEDQLGGVFADACGFSPSLKAYKLSILRNQHQFVLCHGNIRMNHVLVEDDRIQAILDWSQSGYYPQHWDFINATSRIDWTSDWGVFVQKFLKPYYEDFPIWADFMGALR